MLKQKITESIQEVILPDFPDDDDNTATTTVTKSRRVSFGPNFVKEFIVDSAISAQCMPEYEQPFPSSDSSSADSTNSVLSHGPFALQENAHPHKSEPEAAENRPKPPKFASTICFSADSPTADMEFTEGCITLAKSILDKKNKEMTVFIQAKPKGPEEEEKAKEEETNYFEGSQFEMSMTQCLKSKDKKREENRSVSSEKTRIFARYEDEMSMTRCERFLSENEERNWEETKENRMPLDAIMRYLDKDESDEELFSPEKSFAQLLAANSHDSSDGSEKLNLNESMEISGDAQALEEDDRLNEPSIADLKLIESLKEQAMEEGCVWSLRDVQYPQKKEQGLLLLSCRLLESTASLQFILKISNEDGLISWSRITDSSILLDEEKECRHPEYSLAVGFGFDELVKYFRSLQKVDTIRQVPYFMDLLNSFLSEMNSYLVQIHSILTSYPGSRLNDRLLSFRLFSFPVLFSCVVSINLSDIFRLSRASLTFEHDFGRLDENKVGEIFEQSLKGKSSLCEFVVQSTKYLVELERPTGCLSKRNHIRLLPEELKS